MNITLSKTGEFSSNGTTGTGSSLKHSVKYKLVSTDFIDTGEAWLRGWNRIRLTAPVYMGCKLTSVDVEGVADNYGQVFNVTANYDYTEDETLWATISFSTRGGREKKIHSIATQSYPSQLAKAVAPPDFKHAVGYNNGVFEGVDVVVPAFGFSLEVDLPSAIFTPAQIAYFHGLTGKTNAQPFWIFQPEECLFTGMNGNSYRKANDLGAYELWYKLSFEFEAMPSLVNANIEPFQGVNKPGQHYMWVLHEDAKDEQAGITIPVPEALYVEKVYETGDFNWFTMLQW